MSRWFTNSTILDLIHRQDAMQLPALTLGSDLLQPAPQREPLRTVLYLQEHLQAVYGGCGCPADGARQPCRHSTEQLNIRCSGISVVQGVQDHPADLFALETVCARQPCRQQRGCNGQLLVLEVFGARVQSPQILGHLCLSALHTSNCPASKVKLFLPDCCM